jgi:hypothetical protein
MNEEQSVTIARRFARAQEAARGNPHVINLDGEDIVRVVSNQGADELDLEGVSYRRRDDGGFRIPRRHLDFSLRNIGGLVEQPLSKKQALQSIATTICEMPKCRERDALAQALVDLFEPGSE